MKKIIYFIEVVREYKAGVAVKSPIGSLIKRRCMQAGSLPCFVMAQTGPEESEYWVLGWRGYVESEAVTMDGVRNLVSHAK